MKFLVLGLLLASLSALPGCSKDDPAKPGKDELPGDRAEVDKLQGKTCEVKTWKENGVENRGFVEFGFTQAGFQRRRARLEGRPGKPRGYVQTRLQGNLRTMDLIITDGSHRIELGIDEVDGDELRITFLRVALRCG